MKNFIFSAAVILLAGTCSAQSATSPLRPISFGIKAGPNFSTYSPDPYGYRGPVKIIPRLQAGVYADIHLRNNYYLQVSLEYNEKGGVNKVTNYKTLLSYLELPLNFLYKLKTNNGSAFFAGIGAYVAYGISGYHKWNMDDFFFPFSGDPFKTGPYDTPLFSRFDGGMNLQLGYEIPMGLNIGLNGDLGMVNITKQTNPYASGNNFTNISFAVTIGYTLKVK